jgi:hypothetical protein
MVANEGDETHAGTERVWDVLLIQRLAILGKEPFFGLATDDSHNYHDDPKKQSRSGRGWVVVRSARLAVEDLIAAMEAGDFYSSSGVTFKDVRREKDRLAVEIEAEPGVTYTTEFIGTRKGFDQKSEPVTDAANVVQRGTRRYSKDVGAVLTTVTGLSASYSLKGDEIYVRARVVSSKLKENPYREGEFEQAWTQPLITVLR